MTDVVATIANLAMSFLDEPLVLVLVVVGGAMATALLLPLAAELGRRSEAQPGSHLDSS